jgi:hypothetical protein
MVPLAMARNRAGCHHVILVAILAAKRGAASQGAAKRGAVKPDHAMVDGTHDLRRMLQIAIKTAPKIIAPKSVHQNVHRRVANQIGRLANAPNNRAVRDAGMLRAMPARPVPVAMMLHRPAVNAPLTEALPQTAHAMTAARIAATRAMAHQLASPTTYRPSFANQPPRRSRSKLGRSAPIS